MVRRSVDKYVGSLSRGKSLVPGRLARGRPNAAAQRLPAGPRGRGGAVLVRIAWGDPELGQRLRRPALVGGSGGGATAELALHGVGGRFLRARAGEHRAEQNEDENKGKAGQADPDTLHATIALHRTGTEAKSYPSRSRLSNRFWESGRSAHAGPRRKPLDCDPRAPKVQRMRALTPLPFALAACAALGACNNKPTTIVAGDPGDPQTNEMRNAKAVPPPKMIQASRTYRCADNSLVYADFYTDNTVSVRTQKDGAATILTAEGGKPPYKATGYSLSGNGTSVSFDTPTKKAQACTT